MVFQAPPARTQISPLPEREGWVEWVPAPDAHFVQPVDEERGGGVPPNSGRSWRARFVSTLSNGRRRRRCAEWAWVKGGPVESCLRSREGCFRPERGNAGWSLGCVGKMGEAPERRFEREGEEGSECVPSSSSSMMASSLLTELWRSKKGHGRQLRGTYPMRLSWMMTFHIGISRWK